jgi:hypothetical protein
MAIEQPHRKIWLLVLAFAMFLCARPTLGQTKAGADADQKSKQQLLDLENHWLQVEHDPDALETILAPDFLHVAPAGIITREEQIDFMRKHQAPPAKPEEHFEDMHVRVYGTVGIVNGVVVAKTAEGTRRTLFTDVFAYRDGKWQAINAQELPAGMPH